MPRCSERSCEPGSRNVMGLRLPKCAARPRAVLAAHRHGLLGNFPGPYEKSFREVRAGRFENVQHRQSRRSILQPRHPIHCHALIGFRRNRTFRAAGAEGSRPAGLFVRRVDAPHSKGLTVCRSVISHSIPSVPIYFAAWSASPTRYDDSTIVRLLPTGRPPLPNAPIATFKS